MINKFITVFGCNEGGGIIQLVQQLENLDFKDAVEFLADRAGIELPKYEQTDLKEDRFKERCYMVNKSAMEFFKQELYKPYAKIAQDYINKRKITKEALDEFSIGYSGRGLYQHLKSKGFTDKEIFAVGLAYIRDDKTVVDRYINRLMFTIKDVKGRVIGFSGRILTEEKQAKYINSNENIVYHKGRTLFGIDIAKKYSQEEIIVVEGQMDAISLSSRGIKNVVASMGTALTESQCRLLIRHSKKIIIAYDTDDAGIQATIRGLDILKSLGADVKVIQLAGAKDPDEFVIKYGQEAFKKAITEAITLFEYKEEYIRSKYDLQKPDDKVKYLNEVIKELVKIENTVEREVYIDIVSKNTKIIKDVIKIEVNKLVKEEKNTLLNIVEFEKNKKQNEQRKKEKSITYDSERQLLKLIIENPETIKKVLENIDVSVIYDEENQRLFEYIKETYYNLKEDEELEKLDFVYDLETKLNQDKNEEEQLKLEVEKDELKKLINKVYEVLSIEVVYTKENFEKLLKYFIKQKLEKEIELLTRALELEQDAKIKNDLLINLNEVMKKLRNIK